MRYTEFLLTGAACSPSLVALQRFLQEKAIETSAKNCAHLFESLYPLCQALPNLAEVTFEVLTRKRVELRSRYSNGSIRSKIVDWRTFFRWCKKRKLVKRNPAKRLSLPKVRGTNKAATDADVQAVMRSLAGRIQHRVVRNLFGQLEAIRPDLWNSIERHAVRDLFILTFLYESGARGGELANLTVKDMMQALQSDNSGELVYSVEVFGKTDEQTYLFTEKTAEVWRVWRQVSMQSNYAVFNWRGREVMQMKTAEISRMLARRCEQAGLAKKFRSHALRHLKMGRLAGMGYGDKFIQEFIGHRNIASTEGYLNPQDATVKQAAIKTGLIHDYFSIV